MKSFLMLLAVSGILFSTQVIANKSVDNQLGGTESDRRQNYINDKQAILKAWVERIDKLEGRAQRGAPPSEIGEQNENKIKPSALTESVANLKKDYKSASEQLKLLRDVRSDQEWGDGSTALEAKLRDMDSTYTHAMAE
jgi:hypothetical protein